MKSFRIFYIPRADLTSTIPDYLAHQDLMYSRIVYWPFKGKMVYPILKNEYKTRDLFPNYFIRN